MAGEEMRENNGLEVDEWCGWCTPGQYRVHKPGDCKGMGKPKDANKRVTIKAAVAEVDSDGYETS
jgi:hypothetical protein